ncbi:MAG: MlaD family protein [Candidatus Omnitrophota bacterium]|jgi:phospholipid/cholesterol/gamma-HCH transport system substrate-binding protein
MASLDPEKALSDFKVGLVTFAALSFLVLGITFAGGEKGMLFKEVSQLKAHMVDVSGLKTGAPVTMGGLTIGRVTDISFMDTSDGTRVEVVMQMRSDLRRRIKTDSLPSVRTQGMMGDRYVDISLGTPAAKILPDGEILIGSSVSQFDETLTQANIVLKEVEKLLNAINHKEGSAGQFLYDQRFYNSLTSTTEDLQSLIQDFKAHPKKYVKLSIF